MGFPNQIKWQIPTLIPPTQVNTLFIFLRELSRDWCFHYPYDRIFWSRWFVGNWDKKSMILCARSTLRSREQRAKRKSRSENVWKVCSCYSQNNKIFWLSSMTDACFKNSRNAQRFVGFFFLICFSDADWLSRQTPITWNDPSHALRAARGVKVHSFLRILGNGKRIFKDSVRLITRFLVR